MPIQNSHCITPYGSVHERIRRLRRNHRLELAPLLAPSCPSDLPV